MMDPSPRAAGLPHSRGTLRFVEIRIVTQIHETTRREDPSKTVLVFEPTAVEYLAIIDPKRNSDRR